MADIKPEQLGEALSAYLDGELDAIETARMEQLLRNDRSARDQLAVLQRTVKLVRSLPRHGAPDSLAEDIQARFERSDLVAGFGEPVALDPPRRTPLLAILSTAAVFAVVAGGMWFMAMDAPDAAFDGRIADAGLAAKDVPFSESKNESSGVSRLKTESFERERRLEERSTPVDSNGLLASATLEQKLTVGMSIASIRSHSFDNETVRLHLRSNDTLDGPSMASRLMSRLEKMGAVDVAHASATRRADAREVGSLFYRGSTHQNFAEGGGTQILVRASPRQLSELLGEVSRHGKAASSVKLTSGPLEVQGLADVRGALTRLGGRSDFAVDPLGALASVLGVDRDDSMDDAAAERLPALSRKLSTGSRQVERGNRTVLDQTDRPVSMSGRKSRRAGKLAAKDEASLDSLSSAREDDESESYVTLVIEIASDRGRSSRSRPTRDPKQ